MEQKKELLNQTKNDNNKWYDTPNLLDFLLFLFPPIGLYGVFKSKKRHVKPFKIIAGFSVFIGLVGSLIYMFL